MTGQRRQNVCFIGPHLPRPDDDLSQKLRAVTGSIESLAEEQKKAMDNPNLIDAPAAPTTKADEFIFRGVYSHRKAAGAARVTKLFRHSRADTSIDGKKPDIVGAFASASEIAVDRTAPGGDPPKDVADPSLSSLSENTDFIGPPAPIEETMPDTDVLEVAVGDMPQQPEIDLTAEEPLDDQASDNIDETPPEPPASDESTLEVADTASEPDTNAVPLDDAATEDSSRLAAMEERFERHLADFSAMQSTLDGMTEKLDRLLQMTQAPKALAESEADTAVETDDPIQSEADTMAMADELIGDTDGADAALPDDTPDVDDAFASESAEIDILEVAEGDGSDDATATDVVLSDDVADDDHVTEAAAGQTDDQAIGDLSHGDATETTPADHDAMPSDDLANAATQVLETDAEIGQDVGGFAAAPGDESNGPQDAAPLEMNEDTEGAAAEDGLDLSDRMMDDERLADTTDLPDDASSFIGPVLPADHAEITPSSDQVDVSAEAQNEPLVDVLKRLVAVLDDMSPKPATDHDAIITAVEKMHLDLQQGLQTTIAEMASGKSDTFAVSDVSIAAS